MDSVLLTGPDLSSFNSLCSFALTLKLSMTILTKISNTTFYIVDSAQSGKGRPNILLEQQVEILGTDPSQ